MVSKEKFLNSLDEKGDNVCRSFFMVSFPTMIKCLRY